MKLNSISFYTTTTLQKPNEKRKTKPRTEKSKIHPLSILCILSQVTQKLKKNAANKGFVFLVLVERNFFMNLPVKFVPYSKVPASFWPKDLRDASW